MESRLLESLRELEASLPGQSPPDNLWDELEGLRASLQERHDLYSGEPPDGAEALYDAMKAGMESYLRALDAVAAFLEDHDPSHLSRAVQLGQEAEDAFQSAEYEIGADQAWLGQFQQG